MSAVVIPLPIKRPTNPEMIAPGVPKGWMDLPDDHPLFHEQPPANLQSRRRQDRLGEVSRLAMLMQPHVFDVWIAYARVVTGGSAE